MASAPTIYGPRPLPQYLALANLLHFGLPNVLHGWNNAWQDIPQLASLLGPIRQAWTNPVFRNHLHQHIQQQYALFLQGIHRYHSHLRPPRLTTPAPIWQHGNTVVRAFAATGRPVVVIPSLINRSQILSLAPDNLLSHLAQAGWCPLVFDWQTPSPEEAGFSLADYITRRIIPFLETLAEPVPVIGYCMGGNLALASACIAPPLTTRLILLATPWDFSQAASNGQRHWLHMAMPFLTQQIQTFGVLPTDILQLLLATLDPLAVIRRYQDMASASPPELDHLIRIEDWLNDGVPLAGPAALEILNDWYIRNTPNHAAWRVNQHVIDPARLSIPTLIVAPRHDKVVPPASSTALAAQIPNSQTHQPSIGHIGMVAGRRALQETWRPVTTFLNI